MPDQVILAHRVHSMSWTLTLRRATCRLAILLGLYCWLLLCGSSSSLPCLVYQLFALHVDKHLASLNEEADLQMKKAQSALQLWWQ